MQAKKNKFPNVTFQRENAYESSFANASFDVVVGSSFLHHLEVEKAVLEVFRVLKPSGVMRFTEPNMLNPQIAMQKNIPYLKRRMGDSPDETAFFRWPLADLLINCGFSEVTVQPFDFLHPRIPPAVVREAEPVCSFCESIPILREIAGSLYITAQKPGK